MCNCKNKETKKPSELKVEFVKNEEPLPVVQADLQEVLIVENMLPDINTNSEKRIVITNFAKRFFGENLVGYCDQVCQRRMKDKLAKLKQSLI